MVALSLVLKLSWPCEGHQDFQHVVQKFLANDGSSKWGVQLVLVEATLDNRHFPLLLPQAPAVELAPPNQ